MRQSTGDLVWDFIVLCVTGRRSQRSSNMRRSKTTALMGEYPSGSRWLVPSFMRMCATR
jgi:hypothetical protein